MALSASRHFLPVTRAMATDLAGRRPNDWFEQAGIPTSSGYRILKFYETHGATRTQRGRLEIDVRRVLNLQGGLRADRALADRRVAEGPPLDHLSRILDDMDVPYAIGFHTAANSQAYFEPVGVHCIYLGSRSGLTDARTAKTIAVRLAASAQASPHDPYEIYVDRLEVLDVQRGPLGPMTSPVQTLLDLSIHPRNAAHREFMFDLLKKQGVING